MKRRARKRARLLLTTASRRTDGSDRSRSPRPRGGDRSRDGHAGQPLRTVNPPQPGLRMEPRITSGLTLESGALSETIW
ncbi:hypothetical protein FHX41_4991 [Actinomadura hallensis]|uniref:Uncharacterized protein n=1 Tax=Actinomadura hallensis TaxID=337895 RepID=A0A543IKY8_9ACTN|nr:hypothetical protein FHX41_4991 [Actinomadura hallensis]